MILLSRDSIQNKPNWEKLNITLPKFNYKQVLNQTNKTPKWIHFGAGNIFRGFIANTHQNLLDNNLASTGIIAVESFDFEIIDKIYIPYDNLTLLVTMNSNGNFNKKVIGSIVKSLTTNSNDYKNLIEIFENPSLQICSFTITEKGYSLTDSNGHFLEIIKKDFKNGLTSPIHTLTIVTSLIYKRYLKGKYPMTFLSMDNCSNNGDKLKAGILEIAKKWLENNFVNSDFINYLEDDKKISFPLSMIDKITPRPSLKIKQHLDNLNIGNMDIVITSKNSYMAPFVNTEVSEYLVIEDNFTNGRPSLENSGVIFTNRETVNKVETMKVTTCLNPLHTALAVTGCLLGYTLIADEMKNPTLKRFVEVIGYEEGLKVVTNPKIINPKEFLDEVINKRFKNPFIPDTPQRIATDTSQKVAIRFGETIKAYHKSEHLDVLKLIAIPLAIALWCRYLLGIDDNETPFTLSPDPMLEKLQDILKDTSNVKQIISSKEVFGVDLYKIGIGNKIEKMFYELIDGKDAVKNTLAKYIK